MVANFCLARIPKNIKIPCLIFLIVKLSHKVGLKNLNLLIKGLLESGSNRMGGGIYSGFFHPIIALWIWIVFFAAIPGSIGFFYFIGSLALVFLGMFSLTIALVLFEIITFRLTELEPVETTVPKKGK